MSGFLCSMTSEHGTGKIGTLEVGLELSLSSGLILARF
jgi:hypothetical protein